MKKIAKIIMGENKNSFIDVLAGEKYSISGVNITNVNTGEGIVRQLSQKYKDYDFVVIDFDMLDRDIPLTTSTIRSLERMYDSKYIILLNSLDENLVYEFTINGIYNFVNVGNTKLLNDILDGKVDGNYDYIFEDPDEKKTDLIFDFELTNISVSSSKENEFLSFLLSLNLVNYLDSIKSSAYYINCQNKKYLESLEFINAIEAIDKSTFKSKTCNIIYSFDEAPHYLKDSSACACVYDLGSRDTKINSDIKIFVSDSSIINVEKVKNKKQVDGEYIFIINPVKELVKEIEQRNDTKFIPKIKSVFSLENFEVFEEIFEENAIISYL